MAKAEVTVAVERAVHNVLREMAQALWNEHGICLKGVRFSWVDLSTPAEPRLTVAEVEAETLTKV